MDEEKLQDKSIRSGILAFIDVLGFSEFLSRNTPQNEKDEEKISRLNEMIQCYDDFFSYHKSFAFQQKKYINDYDGGEYSVISYSDCISFFISDYPLKNISLQKNQLGTLIAQLAHSQYEFASNSRNYELNDSSLKLEHQDKFLMKGGLIQGYGYVNENLVTGPAQLQSYKFGDKSNIYPRILIQKEIISESKFELRNNPLIAFQDEDQFFINYLQIAIQDNNPDIEGLNRIHDFISYNLNFGRYCKHCEHCRNIVKKYQWTAKYYNAFCEHSSLQVERIDSSLITDTEIIKMLFTFDI
jgi:hypothetical protein